MELAAAVVWKSSEKKAWHQLSILYYDSVVDFFTYSKTHQASVQVSSLFKILHSVVGLKNLIIFCCI